MPPFNPLKQVDMYGEVAILEQFSPRALAARQQQVGPSSSSARSAASTTSGGGGGSHCGPAPPRLPPAAANPAPPLAANVCRLYDYGCDDECLYLVLKDYRCSLKEWRGRHAGDPARQLLLYLNVYLQALQAVEVRTGLRS